MINLKLKEHKTQHIKAAVSLLAIFFIVWFGVLGRVSTSSAISADGNLGVYSDSGCTQEVSSLDWKTLSPGSTITRSVYVKNHGETDIVLGIDSTNWSPSVASSYMSINWDREDFILGSNMVTRATITLSASKSITGVDNFSFQTKISGSQENVLIFDDIEASFKGKWKKGGYSGYYGTGYRYNSAGSGSHTATWSFTIPEQGVWEVYAYWVSGRRRATNAPYTINGLSSTVVRVNQKDNGEEWVSLGDHLFNKGATSIVLSDDANEIVVADAIKLVFRGALPANKPPSVDWIKAWGPSGRLDPGGDIAIGEWVRIYTQVSDPETALADLVDVTISYRPSEGSWIDVPAIYNPTYDYWDIPRGASLGLYDVRIKATDSDSGSIDTWKLGKFEVAN